MVRRTKEESEKTRQLLLDAAEKVFLKKGVAAATLEDIANSARLTRGAVYWHFKNKEDLFQAMHERVKLPMDELFEQAIGTEEPLEALKKLCIYSLQNLAKDARTRRIYTILILKFEQGASSKAHQNRRKEVIKKFQVIFEQAKRQNKICRKLESETVAIGLQSYMFGIFTEYLRNPKEFDIAQLAPSLVKIFFWGLETND